MAPDLAWVFGLLVLFQIKHYLGDFPLQTTYMLQKQKSGWDFFVPLAVHTGIHGVLSLAIILAVNVEFWWLAVLDAVTHFLMDRIKAGPRYLGRYSDHGTAAYWNCFGFDQMVHHLTNFYMVWVLVTGKINPWAS